MQTIIISMTYKAIIHRWKDGDSGELVNENGNVRSFRLANVFAPEKREPGYELSRARSRRYVSNQDVVDVEVVGTDAFGRDLVKIKKRGRDINKMLNMKNTLFGIDNKKNSRKQKQSKKTKRRK